MLPGTRPSGVHNNRAPFFVFALLAVCPKYISYFSVRFNRFEETACFSLGFGLFCGVIDESVGLYEGVFLQLPRKNVVT